MVGGELDVSLRTMDASGDPLISHGFRNLFELNRSHTLEEASLLLTLIWKRLNGIETFRRVRMRHHPALVRAMDNLEEHYSELFSVSDLVRRAGVSQSHLNELFRHAAGGGAGVSDVLADEICPPFASESPFQNRRGRGDDGVSRCELFQPPFPVCTTGFRRECTGRTPKCRMTGHGFWNPESF